ncbi:MAG: hypothetical protein FWD73_13640 [Polyangiaceae bacterium]|nr:hypothetical protein [Polyangiaceae bacterium]
MKNYSFAGLLVAVGCLASCGGPFGDAPGSSGSGSSDGGSGQTNGGTGDADSGGGSGKLDGGNVDPGPTFSFVQPQNLWVYVQQGQPASVTINITRGLTPGTDITIRATSQPDGVTVDSLTILSGSSTGQLTVKVGASVPQGEVTVKLQGLAEGATVTVPMDLQLFVISGKPGTLDTSFASGGIYEDTTVDYYSVNAATPPQSDGKILVGAATIYDSLNYSYASAVIRLNTDGAIDSTLSDPAIKSINGGLFGVAAYPDGRIVTIENTGAIDSIKRYKANGAFDTTLFATTNSSLPNNWTSFYLYAIAVGPDDSIYAGGWASIPSSSSAEPYALIQIPANGQGSMPICSGFGDTNHRQVINNLSLLPTGALAFAGPSYSLTAGESIRVGRYPHPPSCDLDPNYGNNDENKGIWYSTDWQFFADAFFETDGSVDLLAGQSGTSTYSLVRIDNTGSPAAPVSLPVVCSYCNVYENSSFHDGGNGGITRAPDGRYLVAGQYKDQATGNTSMVVAYYNSDLTPDMTMGNQGVVTIPIPISTPLASPILGGLRAVYTPDGSLTVVVGRISGKNAAGTAVQHLVVARIWN